LLTSVHRRPEKAIHTVQVPEIRLFNGGHDRVPLHPQDIAVRTLRVGIHLVPVHETRGMERRTHHVHTQHGSGAPSHRLSSSK